MMYRTAILMTMLLTITGLEAQEPENPEPTSTASGTEVAGQENEAVNTGAASNTATPESFKPSEEISEDLSVSFPVDI